MKRSLHIIIIFIIIFALPGCLNKKTSTSLTYYPLAANVQLTTGEPKESMRLAKEIPFKETDGLPSSTLHLYVDIEKSNLIYGFLETVENWHDVGIVSNEGIHIVDVDISHWTGAGNSEIQITSPMNPKSEQLLLLLFNHATMSWEKFDFQ